MRAMRLTAIPPKLWALLAATGVLVVLLYVMVQPPAQAPTPTPIPISPEERADLIAYARQILELRNEAFSLGFEVQKWERSQDKSEETFLPLYQQAQALLQSFQDLTPPDRAAGVHGQFLQLAGTTKEALEHRLNWIRSGAPQEEIAYRGLLLLAQSQSSSAFGAFWSLYDSVGIGVEEIVESE